MTEITHNMIMSALHEFRKGIPGQHPQLLVLPDGYNRMDHTLNMVLNKKSPFEGAPLSSLLVNLPPGKRFVFENIPGFGNKELVYILCKGVPHFYCEELSRAYLVSDYAYEKARLVPAKKKKKEEEKE